MDRSAFQQNHTPPSCFPHSTSVPQVKQQFIHTPRHATSSKTKTAKMKHLILVGACYLDTILRQVIPAHAPLILLTCPAACLTSPKKTPSSARQISRSAGEATARTHSRCSSSSLQTKTIRNCTSCRVCRTGMPPAPGESSRHSGLTPESISGTAYIGRGIRSLRAATSSEASRAIAAPL